MLKMIKKENLLILFVGVVISACAFCGFMSKNTPKSAVQSSKEVSLVKAEEAEGEQSDEESVLSYDDIVEAYYKNRPIRNVPDTADFSAYLAGEYAKEDNDFPAAATYFKRAADADVENPDFQKEAALYTVLAGDVKGALPYARRVLEKTPDDFFNQLLVLSTLIKDGKKDEVLKQADGLSSQALFGFVAPLIKAWIYAEKGDKESALATLNSLEGNENVNLRPLYHLHSALIYDYFDDVDSAAEAYNKLLHDKASHSVRTLLLTRSFEERTGKLPEKDFFVKTYLQTQANSFVSNEAMARRPYQEKIDTLPKALSLIFFDVGGSLGYTKNYDSALYLAQLSLYLDPENMLNVYFVGDVLEAMDATKQADALYAKVKKNQPLYWSFRIKSVMNQIKAGQLDKAIEGLKKMIAERPDYPLFYMTLGDAYKEKGNFAKAKEAYDGAIEKMGVENKEVGVLYFLRGVCHEKLLQMDKALTDMEKAVSLDKDNPVYLNYLGYMMLENKKDLPRAMTLIEKAVRFAPDNGAFLDSQGWGYYLMEKYDLALPLLEKAVQLESQNAVVNDHLGDVYWKLDRKREARFQWNHALTLKEENSEDLQKKIKEKLKNQK